MKKLFTLLLLTMLMGLNLSAQTATATWSFDSQANASAGVAAVVDPTGDAVFSSTSLAIGSDLEYRRQTTIDSSADISAADFYVAAGCNTNADGNALIMTINIANNVAFQPTNLSFIAAGIGSGSLRLGYTITNGTDTKSVDEVTLTKWANASNNYVANVDLPDFSASNASVVLKLFLRTTDTSKRREVAVSNVVVTGTYSNLSGPQLLHAPEISVNRMTGEATITGDANATAVYYTTDGTEPSADNGTEYTAAFTVTDGTVIKAIAIGDGENYANSQVTTVTAKVGIETPVIRTVNGTVEITCETEGAVLSYSVDGGAYLPYNHVFTLLENGSVTAKATLDGFEAVSEATAVTVPASVEGATKYILYLDKFDMTDAKNLVGKDELAGWKLTSMNSDFKTSKKGDVTVGENTYAPICMSQNRTFNIILPEGKKAKKVTFYSYVNDNDATKDSYWSNVAGDASNDMLMWAFQSREGFNTDPDIRIYALDNCSFTVSTASTGKTLAFVAEVEVVDFYNTLPMTSDYLSWKDALVKDAAVQNREYELGSTYDSATASFCIDNTVEQPYLLQFFTGHKSGTPTIHVALKDEDGAVVKDLDATLEQTNNWNMVTPWMVNLGTLPVGKYSLDFSVTDMASQSFAGNWGNVSITSPVIPGTLSLASGKYTGARTENDNTNIGYVTTGAKAEYTAIVDKEGTYFLTLDIARYNTGGTMTIKVADYDTKEVESTTNYVIASDAPGAYTSTSIKLAEPLTAGLKTIEFSFDGGENSSFICNYKAPTFGFKDVYFVGVQTEWLDNKIKMNTEDGQIYTLTLADGITGEWKICDGTWGWNYGLGENRNTVEHDFNGYFNSGLNFDLRTVGETSIVFNYVDGSDVDGSTTPAIMRVTGTPYVEYKKVYFIGYQNDNWSYGTEMETTDGITYTLLLENGLDGEWLIYDGEWEGWKYGMVNDYDQVRSFVPYDAKFGNDAKNFKYNTERKVQIVLVLGEDNAATVTVQPHGYVPVYWDNTSRDGWTTPYVHYWSKNGDLAETTWPGVPMRRVPAGASLSNRRKVNAADDVWEVEVPKEATHIIFSNNGADQTDKAGFEFTPGYIYTHTGEKEEYNGTTGVDKVEAATDAPVYYNMQGVRVVNPQNGVFIVVRGSKVTKEVVR